MYTMSDTFLDGYCSTVQDLLDWFEVDLGFTTHMSDTTHPHVSHEAYMSLISHTLYVQLICHESSMYVPWLYIWVTQLIHMCLMTHLSHSDLILHVCHLYHTMHPYMSHDSIHKRHNSSTCVSRRTYLTQISYPIYAPHITTYVPWLRDLFCRIYSLSWLFCKRDQRMSHD